MKKTTLNTALLLLLSLGVVACGSKQNETVINSAPNTSAAELVALQKKLNETEQALAKAEQNTQTDTQAELAKTQNELAETQQALATAEKNAETATKNLTELQTSQTATQAELTQTKAENTDLQATLSTARAELTKAQQDVAELKAALAQTNDNSSLQTQLNIAQTNLKAAEEKVATLERAIKANETKEKVWADKIVADLTAGGFGKQATSHTYAYLNDENKKAELLDALAKSSGVCNQATSASQAISCTAADTQAGTILFTKNNEFSGYAVVREAFDTGSDGKLNTPKNSYIAIVKTPTTDKAQVLGASYSGSATYTLATGRDGTTMVGENLVSPTAANINAVSLTVDADGKISGGIWNRTSANEARHFQTVEFKETDVLVGSNGVVFAGDASIRERMNASSKMISGTYQGAFAGSQGQEVVGTFSSDSRQDNYIHGAFSATKDSVE